MKDTIKELKACFTELYQHLLRPLAVNFWKVAPGQTFVFAMLTGFNLSVFFHDLGYALAVFIAFVISIFLFVRLYQKSRVRLLQEERERIEKLCQTVDRYMRRNCNE